jgi:hypothetical protein
MIVEANSAGFDPPLFQDGPEATFNRSYNQWFHAMLRPQRAFDRGYPRLHPFLIVEELFSRQREGCCALLQS